MKKIYIASDHAGYNLKNFIKKKLHRKFKIIDLGANSNKISVNYPDYAHKLCKKVSSNDEFKGILVCGSGIGMSMAANRHKKIRAALCNTLISAKLSRLHNNANVITLGERVIKKNTAEKCVNIFLTTEFEGGRHLKRIKKI
jgi:ribose 5-phosphate isomerase B